MPGSIYTHYTTMPSCYTGRSPQWPNDSDHLQDPKPAVSSRTWGFEHEEGWKQGEWRHLTLAGQGLEHTDILGTMALEVFYNLQVTTKVWPKMPRSFWATLCSASSGHGWNLGHPTCLRQTQTEKRILCHIAKISEWWSHSSAPLSATHTCEVHQWSWPRHQSIVVQLTKAGKRRARLQRPSPTGEKQRDMWRFFRTREM